MIKNKTFRCSLIASSLAMGLAIGVADATQPCYVLKTDVTCCSVMYRTPQCGNGPCPLDCSVPGATNPSLSHYKLSQGGQSGWHIQTLAANETILVQRCVCREGHCAGTSPTTSTCTYLPVLWSDLQCTDYSNVVFVANDC